MGSVARPRQPSAVDFELRDRLLRQLDEAGPRRFPNLVANWPDGRVKLFVTAAAYACGASSRTSSRTAVTCRSRPRSRCPPTSSPSRAERGSDAVIVARATLGIGRDGPPLGADCWKTSRVMLPPAFRDRVFRDIFTAEIRPTMKSDDAWIFVGQIFDQLPVAMLRAT